MLVLKSAEPNNRNFSFKIRSQRSTWQHSLVDEFDDYTETAIVRKIFRYQQVVSLTFVSYFTHPVSLLSDILKKLQTGSTS